ncbi:uncharacterized protein [Symphalangus syndactylus]|uniref:uncharacterized protein n=1 Tax=Symphalangus syndactylus TaxID=9590 RepID=UPI003006AB7C
MARTRSHLRPEDTCGQAAASAAVPRLCPHHWALDLSRPAPDAPTPWPGLACGWSKSVRADNETLRHQRPQIPGRQRGTRLWERSQPGNLNPQVSAPSPNCAPPTLPRPPPTAPRPHPPHAPQLRPAHMPHSPPTAPRPHPRTRPHCASPTSPHFPLTAPRAHSRSLPHCAPPTLPRPPAHCGLPTSRAPAPIPTAPRSHSRALSPWLPSPHPALPPLRPAHTLAPSPHCALPTLPHSPPTTTPTTSRAPAPIPTAPRPHSRALPPLGSPILGTLPSASTLSSDAAPCPPSRPTYCLLRFPHTVLCASPTPCSSSSFTSSHSSRSPSAPHAAPPQKPRVALLPSWALFQSRAPCRAPPQVSRSCLPRAFESCLGALAAAQHPGRGIGEDKMTKKGKGPGWKEANEGGTRMGAKLKGATKNSVIKKQDNTTLPFQASPRPGQWEDVKLFLNDVLLSDTRGIRRIPCLVLPTLHDFESE